MADTAKIGVGIGEGYAKGYDPEKFSPLRHCRGAQITWETIEMMKRANGHRRDRRAAQGRPVRVVAVPHSRRQARGGRE
jgi:hypothetical protein